MEQNITQLEKEIARLQTELDKAKDKKAKLSGLSEAELLAITMHDCMCHHNHTDGCGWYYGMHNGVPKWETFAQKEYLKRARIMLHHMDYRTAHNAIVLATDSRKHAVIEPDA